MISAEPWLLLILGYTLTVLIEVPVLCVGLSGEYSIRDRWISGMLLTAFTYPFVVMILPAVMSLAGIQSRLVYLLVAETWAPVGEVVLFRYLHRIPMRKAVDRNAAVIVIANLCSFAAGEAGLSRWIHEIASKVLR